MKQLYLLLTLALVTLLGLPTRVLGQCNSRPVGSGRYTAIDAGLLNSCRASFTDTKNNAPGNCFGNFFESPQGGQPSEEIFYRFTLDAKQKVTISHCGSGFDTFLTLLDGSGNVLAAANDTSKANTSCGSGNSQEAYLKRSLPAGTYYVVSEGYGIANGNITTQISVSPTQRRGAVMANAIDAGTLSTCGAYFSDTQRLDAASCFGNDYDQSLNSAQLEGRPTDDIFYKFTLTSSTEVSIAHCNTGQRFIDGRDPDTYVHLLDANGNRLVSNDDYGPVCYSGRSSLRLTLAPGTYYVVSELYNSDSYCNLITTISTTSATPVSVVAPTTTLVAGGTTTLTASGANTYTWSPATGLSATTGSNVTAAPTRTTTYTVTGSGNGNCSQSSATITLVVSSVPAAPSDPAQDLNRNWSFTRTYDLDGNITGEAKQFTDAMGRPTQSQSKNIAAKQVFASQVINNTGGKGVLSTLPAPIFNQEFKYRTDFITNASGTAYSAQDFEGVSSPAALNENTVGTLGYYYSQNNTWEPAIAATHNPFSLTEPNPGPLGGIRRAAGPGDVFAMGAGHESKGRDFSLLNELDHYGSLRPQFVPGSAITSLRGQGIKVVSVNTNGVESIAFANREGQALASCLSGDQYPATTLTGTLNADLTNTAGSPVYQDIHISASLQPTTVTLTGTSGGTDSFVVIDLLNGSATGTAYTGSQTLSLSPGFYRLQATEGQFAFSYSVHYGNFSYSYYDDAGRVIATVAPNGLPNGTNFVRNASFDQEQVGTNSPTHWQSITTPTGASYTENFSPAHSGTYYCGQWQPGGTWNAYTYQVIKNLVPGKYTMRAWVESTGGQLIARMQAQSPGGTLRQVAYPNMADWMSWQQLVLTDIEVNASGQCEIGFYSSSNSSTWIRFDDVELVRQVDNSTPTFVTRNTYDTASRLLQKSSPDEGTTQYVYARDGRIRFSQSARQLTEGKFSYSNYDAVGRVVESGEYQMANDRTQGVVFESPLNLPTGLYEAENAQLTGAGVTNVWPGYSGSGFVGYISQPNSSAVKFTVANVPVAGNYYPVDVRYAVGLSDTRTMSVYVNGNYVQQASFPTTNSWAIWSTQTLLLTLQGGTNFIEFRYDSGDNGNVNLDYIRVLSNTTVANSVLNENILEDRTRTGGLETARCSQRNQVWYDLPFQDAALSGRTQDFVLGGAAKTTKDGATTWYSYNDLGQLTWMVQEQPVVGIKTLDYNYDAAGNVLTAAYQKNQSDAFYHHYIYDANQRLTQAYTSLDGTTKTLQAAYFYYLHGPLKRVELAGNLQGLDYTYTVQGWLKTLNDSQRSRDPGKDGPAASGMFKDLFGMRMEYFDNDYRSGQAATINPTVSLNQTKQRYDGTVRATSWRTEASAQTYGMAYLYDAKAQLLEANFATVTNGTAFNFGPTRTNGEDNLSYDANGNIGSLRRLGATGVATDNFTYQYLPGTNKLAAVNNPAGSAVLDYDYDATGQMTRQRDEQGQRYLRYDASGKVTGVFRDQARTQPLATFVYNDRGFRSSKATYNATGQLLRTTFSVRDMQGNEVSTYVQEGYNVVQRTEVPIYAASRLGTLTRLDDGSVDPRYELNDHLGNARVVFHKPKTTKYTATMEQSVTSQDDQQFQNLSNPRVYDNTAPSGQYVTSTYGANGPSKQLSVEKGDTITFSAMVTATGDGSTVPFRTSARTIMIVAGAIGSNSTFAPPRGLETMSPSRSGLLPALGRLGLGISITGLLQPKTPAKGTPTGSRLPPVVFLHYRFYDTNNVLQAQGDQQLSGSNWQYIKLGFRAPSAGRLELSSGLAAGTEARFDDVTYEQTGGMIVQEQHTYAYGAPLPGLNYVIGTKKYRHGYQGQYAEKDEETGWDDFELRMYDSRIGRWTAPDPMGQYHSPYVGMGNNPVSSIDPDGGLDLGVIWGQIKSAAGFGRMVGAAAGHNLRYVAGASATWKSIGNTLGAVSGPLAAATAQISATGNSAAASITPFPLPSILRFGSAIGGAALLGIGVLAHMLDKAHDDNRLYFHYTDLRGLNAIQDSYLNGSPIILPNAKGKVYITDVPMTAGQAFRDLFLSQPTHKERGQYVVTFRLLDWQRAQLQHDISQPLELIHPGALRIAPGNFIYAGPNKY